MNVTSIFSAATSFLGGIKTYLIVGAASALVAFLAGSYVEHRIMANEVTTLKLADAKFTTDQVKLKAKSDAAQAEIDLSDATFAQKTFDDQHLHFVTITKEIHDHVTPLQDTRSCLTVGLARSLRAAADGSDIDALQLAGGQSDDDCSDLTATEVAGWFKAYAEAAIHNSTELTLLQADIKAKHDKLEGIQ